MRDLKLKRRALLAAGIAGGIAARPGAAAAAAGNDLVLGGIRIPYPYVTRAGWGADESLRYRDGVEIWPTEYAPPQALTVHHTHAPDSDGEPAERVRLVYRVHCVDNGWGDIGYHLLVDENGLVYEGRVSGGDGLPVFGDRPGPDGRPAVVTAGHVRDHNIGNAGVALIGSFQTRLPTPAQRRSLVYVLAGLAAATHLDPGGTVGYANPVNGRRRTVPTISGHADWLATDCPGTLFHPTLPSVRDDVQRLIGR
ncbi:hypothetical protein GCM10010123_46080 [Pilimelia anulata]|uniref:Peptidoglycan recognition protein family domain-containing protein n=1 Tax=Pilimelia anulata TaxID=53371 RepID=A0A8J3BKQ8_9ACTN|nr:peptidoglycan recognition family protein [Pilimelia anulata]GGK10936.1 hypothetical protein GCM10010123_46080 [Pilimelia anulata]